MLLPRIPMPPSVNKIYATDFNTRRRFKTKEMLDFERDFSNWIIKNPYILGVVKNYLTTFDKKKLKINIHREFNFLHSDLYCLDGKQKKLDVTNYVKALDDAIAKAIGFDDLFFWKSTEEKIVNTEKFVNVQISVII